MLHRDNGESCVTLYEFEKYLLTYFVPNSIEGQSTVNE